MNIYSEIINTYGIESISLRAVEKRTKDLKEGNSSIFDKPRSGRRKINDLDEPIQQLLTEDPYMSTNMLAEKLQIAKQTVKRIMIEDLEMIKVNFKWIPFKLSDELRQKRVEIAKQMLKFLKSALKQAFDRVYTQDETWIYLENPRKSMWIFHNSPIPTISKPTRIIRHKEKLFTWTMHVLIWLMKYWANLI